MTAEQVALTDDRGVLKTITKSGNPKLRPLKGDKVYVHYTGTYVGGDEDGQEFDCSRKRGSKFDFTLGKGEVISAWDICLATMCVGERCELICSSDYGYKDEKTRKFDIEMFGYDGEDVSFDKDMSVTKSVIEQGETIAPPLAGSSITMTYKNILTDEERSVTYTLGDPTESNVPLGIDVALRKMYLGEKAVVKIKNLKESGDDSNSTPYEVYVKNFDKVPRINSHKTFKEQLEHAESMKSRANEFFKNKKYSISLEIYKRLDEEIMFLTAGQPTESDSLKDFKMKLYCNMALVYFNQKNYGECESFCNKALEIDEKNEKSLFRLGMIKISIGDHDEACKFFNQCISYHPDNVVAKRMLQQSKKKVNEERNKTHKMFRKIYEKCSDTGLGINEPEPKEEPSKDSVSEESEDDEAAGSEKAQA